MLSLERKKVLLRRRGNWVGERVGKNWQYTHKRYVFILTFYGHRPGKKEFKEQAKWCLSQYWGKWDDVEN